MESHIIVAFLLVHSIRLCYQQNIMTCNIGFTNVNGICIENCLDTHVLVNGVCQLKIAYPPQIQNVAPSVHCPNAYFLYNGMCYHNTVASPCQEKACGIFNCPSTCFPFHTTSTSTPISDTTASTTTPSTTPLPPLQPRCPPNTVLIDGVCRLIYCPKGTIYNGRCIEPVCSDGLVWTGQTCGKPEVITTILEIENTFTTELNQTGPVFQQPEVINTVAYHTEAYETATEVNSNTSRTEASRPGTTKKCCMIITPRICKRYSPKWVCFNRQYKRCDDACGNHTVINLRIPKVIDHQSMLVMPPNPPLQACASESCETRDHVDCTGCAQNQRETCSSYCYRYRCAEKRCTFIDQFEYCTKYPGSFGCKSFDGCLDDWCTADD